MKTILPQAQELLDTIKESMPTVYQQETLESILGMFLDWLLVIGDFLGVFGSIAVRILHRLQA